VQNGDLAKSIEEVVRRVEELSEIIVDVLNECPRI